MSPIPLLHLRDFISPNPSPSSTAKKSSNSFSSNPSLPWIIIGIVVGLTILATSTTVLIICYNRRQQRQKQQNPQLVLPITTHQQEEQQKTPFNFLRRKSSTPTAALTEFEQQELQRASMIRKSYASRSWNSLSLDSQMSLSPLSPTKINGTHGFGEGSSSRVNTLEMVNTLERVNTVDVNKTTTTTTRNNMYVEEAMEMETPTTPTELRGTTATNEEGTESTRLKDDWKAWEARVKLERSVSGELHPAHCAGAGADEIVGCVTVTRTAARVEQVPMPIPPRHPGRTASLGNMI